MNLTELVAATADEGGFDSASTGSTPTQITRWLNHAYREMVARSRWRMAQIQVAVTVANQAEYALSDDIVDLEGLLVGDLSYVRVGAKRMWRLKAGSLSLARGVDGVYAPDYSAAAAKQIELWPVPTTSGQLIQGLAALYPTALSDANPNPIVPEEFHEALVDGALALGLRRLEERADQAAAHKAEFDAKVEELRRRLNTRVGSGPVQLAVHGRHV